MARFVLSIQFLDNSLNSKERKKKWLEIRDEYNLDSYDTEYFNRGTEYQADTNRIIDPFYTIDYALDNVLALSFYKKEKVKGVDEK